MKKRILALSVFALLATGAFAQISYGVKAGLNISKLTGDADTDSRMAPYFGGFMNYEMSDKFSLQPELVVSMEGGKDEESETYEGKTYSYDATYKLTFLNIPILAKYKVANGLSLMAGPQLGFKMSGKAEVEDEEADMDMKGMNLSLALGAGYSLESGLGFDLRYNLGLSNLYDGEGDGEFKVNTIQIGVNYKF